MIWLELQIEGKWRINMDKLDEMMQCRDIMEKHEYPIEMLYGITESIDRIITEGMQNRK